jgi:hypothetical protein
MITPEVELFLHSVAELAAQKVFNMVPVKRKNGNQYKLIERVLYQYNDLRHYVDDEESYIEMYLSGDKPRKSKDIVTFSGVMNISMTEKLHATREKARVNLELTKIFMRRIEIAFERLDPEQMDILNSLYLLKNEKIEAIAERLNYDKTTVWRKKRKAVEKFGIYFLGALSLQF